MKEKFSFESAETVTLFYFYREKATLVIYYAELSSRTVSENKTDDIT